MNQQKGQTPKPSIHVDRAGHDIVTSSNITSNIGIAVGRVYQDSVTVSSSRKNGVVPAEPESATLESSCTFDELYERVAAESDATALKPALQRLWTVVTPDDPDAPVDVRDARQALTEITAYQPTDSQRRLLLDWLSHAEHVSQPVLIIARRVLG